MTDQLEQELRDMLTERADAAGHPSFGGEAMVARGRSVRRRRQAVAMAGTAAAVILAVVVSGSLLRPSHESLPADVKPTPSASPLPDDFAKALASIPKGEKLRHELLIGDEIVQPDGNRVRIGLPDGLKPTKASRVPGGWVVEAYQDSTGSSLWFQPDSGDARQLARRMGGGFVISADGRRVAISGDPDLVVTLRELPSGRELGRTQYSAGFGPMAVAIIGDKVILAGAQGGGGGATDLAVWDVPAKKVTRHPDSSSSVGVVDLSRDGSIILSRAPYGCVSIGGLANWETMGGIRQCGADGQILRENVSMSPDGSHVLVGPGESRPQQRLAFGDLSTVRRGDGLVLLQLPLPDPWQLEARALAWEDDRTVLVEMPVASQDNAVVILRCKVDGSRCEAVPLPGPTIGYNAVIPRYGS